VKTVEHWAPLIEEKAAADKLKAEAEAAKVAAEAKAAEEAKIAAEAEAAKAKASEEAKAEPVKQQLKDVLFNFVEEELPELEAFEQVPMPMVKAKSAFQNVVEAKNDL